MKTLLFMLYMTFTRPLAYNIACKSLKPKEYELNVGNCISSLKKDIINFPYQELDWTIYTPTIYVSDPSGFQQKGMKRYKQIFSLIRLFRKLMIKDVDISYRLKYIPESQLILIVWYSKWYSMSNPFSLDAISKFYLDENGKIYKHQIEKIYSNSDFRIVHQLINIIDIFYNHDQEYAFIKQECQYIWDCDPPMNCCDFILFKACCSNDIKEPNNFPNDPIPIPLFIPREDLVY